MWNEFTKKTNIYIFSKTNAYFKIHKIEIRNDRKSNNFSLIR